jgi:hypothetical protein
MVLKCLSEEQGLLINIIFLNIFVFISHIHLKIQTLLMHENEVENTMYINHFAYGLAHSDQ